MPTEPTMRHDTLPRFCSTYVASVGSPWSGFTAISRSPSSEGAHSGRAAGVAAAGAGVAAARSSRPHKSSRP